MQRRLRIGRPIGWKKKKKSAYNPVISNAAVPRKPGPKHSLGIVLHDNRHRLLVQPVRLGHHTFTEPVRDVVRAKQSSDDAEQLQGHQREGGDVPLLQQELLEPQVRSFASGELTPGVAGLADGSLDERVEVAAAVELVLDAQATEDTEGARPLGVDFAFEVEGDASVGEVTGDDENAEGDPTHEGVDG